MLQKGQETPNKHLYVTGKSTYDIFCVYQAWNGKRGCKGLFTQSIHFQPLHTQCKNCLWGHKVWNQRFRDIKLLFFN